MTPLDWRLVLSGYEKTGGSGKPGSDAPSQREHEELMRMYPDV